MVCVMCECNRNTMRSSVFVPLLHPCSGNMVWSTLWLVSLHLFFFSFPLSLIALEDVVGKMSKESFIVRETETG